MARELERLTAADIEAARNYIHRLRAMNPSPAVLHSLDLQEAELDKIERQQSRSLQDA